MKRQRNITVSGAELAAPKWEPGEDDSDPDEDKFNNKKGSSPQRDSRQRKKRKLVVTDGATPSDGPAQVVGPVLYSPAHFLSTDLALSPHQEQDLHVYIFPGHLCATNPSLRTEEIWGSNPYSPESDAVCILQHSGLYDVLGAQPPRDMVALKLVLRIHPGGAELQGTERHGIRSKNSLVPSSVCLSALQFDVLRETNEIVEQFKKAPLYGPPRPERPEAVKSSAMDLSVAPELGVGTSESSRNSSSNTGGIASSSNPVGSFLAPTQLSGHHHQQTHQQYQQHQQHQHKRVSRRHKRPLVEDLDQRVSIDVLPDTILQFNLSNEFSFQYNLNLICDRGIEPSQWTSHRLRNAVLMVETSNQRFELSWEQEAHPHTATNAQFDTYRFALVKSPFNKTRSWHSSTTVPLEAEHATPVFSHLDWSQLVWGPATLTILGTVYNVRRIYWIARSSPPSNAAASSSAPDTLHSSNGQTNFNGM